MSGPFEAGEQALLVDHKGRRYLVRLQPGARRSTSTAGWSAHDLVLGKPEGVEVRLAEGRRAQACSGPDWPTSS